MKFGFLSATVAAAVLALALPAQAKSEAGVHSKASSKQHFAKQHHVMKHRTARTRIRVTRAPFAREPGLRRGYVRGVGEVFFGNGVEGPPNGGAFTYRATNDPSIGYFPSLWAAQRTSECVIDEGYGRFSYCSNN